MGMTKSVESQGRKPSTSYDALKVLADFIRYHRPTVWPGEDVAGVGPSVSQQQALRGRTLTRTANGESEIEQRERRILGWLTTRPCPVSR